MFRRRPAKRGKGFARSHEDITALGDSFGNMLTSPVRDAPPIAREAAVSGFSPRQSVAELPPETQWEPQQELPREAPPQRRPQPQPRQKPAKPARARARKW